MVALLPGVSQRARCWGGGWRCAMVKTASTFHQVHSPAAFMHKLYTADNPFEAHLLRGFLEAHGVTAHVQGDILFSMRGELPMAMDTLPTVWVIHAGELARAELLLDEWRCSNKDGEPPWRCRQCGEECDGSFDACWQCGTVRA